MLFSSILFYLVFSLATGAIDPHINLNVDINTHGESALGNGRDRGNWHNFLAGEWTGNISQEDFEALCRGLFQNEHGKPYPLEQTILNNIFTIFDQNKDHVIDEVEFMYCWENWIKQIIHPVTALLIVDVQNDFITGSLPVKNAIEVVAPINHLLDQVQFDMVVYTQDWHPENHISFFKNRFQYPVSNSSPISATDAVMFDTIIFDNNGTKIDQTLWPRHCVENTSGAELQKDLKILAEHLLIYKGNEPAIDSYSAFWSNNKMSHTILNKKLKARGVTDVYVCGIAYDVCVGYTAKDSLALGYGTTLIEDCTRGINETNIQATRDYIIAHNGHVVQSSEIKSLVNGRDRPLSLGYKRALEIAKLGKQ